ncbi:MAG TPA: tRNA (adenosine(37)-N6)-threonylcarbamoyltransferase complex transferase subunit TsaD [Patescibacteria group bacterium]|nr:tRNA (adenosine(37)-N6)-threonylcarbamoyltransferase complex transferase subunit TsaD [Patescibacteria group bacterium]
MKILGIETSCDETAAAVVENGHTLLSNKVTSSIDLHKVYGGVVPEIAARSHIEYIIPVITGALEEANCNWSDIDAISVTYGAGLGGSLLVGVITARSLAISFNKPLIAINHARSHIYGNFITKTELKNYSLPKSTPSFPFIGLILSGGHSQIVLFKSHSDYKVLGKTQDDAIGEAFDKVAKILGLPYPGGPSISKLAQAGDPDKIDFPKPHMQKYDFSFSGLKTAVLRYAQKSIGESYTFPSKMLSERLTMRQKADIAASFEKTAIEYIVDKVKAALKEFKVSSLVVAGGVAANMHLRKELARLGIELFIPDIKLCTDNAAMVASLGYYLFKENKQKSEPYKLDIEPSLMM